MNNSTSKNTIITLEEITRRKNEKREEVRKSKARMVQTIRGMFVPEENKGGVEGLMQHVSTGIAVYDGVMTGIKIMRRIKSLFIRKRR